MNSVWNENNNIRQFKPLEKNITTDVLIIGSGIAGLLCAYELKKADVDCVLVEAKKICSGITGNTTAKISVHHGLIYNKISKKYGTDAAMLYLESHQQAVDKYKILCKNIDCNFEEKDSYVYSMNDRKKIETEVICLKKLGIDADFCESVNLPINVAGAVRVGGQAQFHPLKFTADISKELNIYENTKVLELMPGKAITNCGKINFNKVVVTTHFPFINKHGMYFMKMYQHRSYVIALEGAENINGMYIDEDEKGLSFRNYNNLLLLGGGAHRTGKNGGSWKELENFARKYYPSAKIINKWATQDCMTLDGIPYIGQYSKNTFDMYVATGFNKWGMTSSMVAATILCDMINGKKSKFEELYNPLRSMMHGQLAVNLFETTIGLLTPATPRCPHLGCALKYNTDEHSWDCPCHGSRFGENGALLDNPATDDIKKNISKN